LMVDDHSYVKRHATKSFSSRRETASPEEMELIEDYEVLIKLGLD
jgi:hypothetical protein